MWNLIAKLAAKPAVAGWLIRRALKTPYRHIAKGGDVYMERFWLFNPYPFEKVEGLRHWAEWLPSMRIHWIRRPDQDRHMHSHPWDCRTIILRGAYTEKRLVAYSLPEYVEMTTQITRGPGDTATLDIKDYHSIETISVGGVWTLFITWKYQGTWGFLVNGKKVPYKEYLPKEEQ
jgi:hypothetical protein